MTSCGSGQSFLSFSFARAAYHLVDSSVDLPYLVDLVGCRRSVVKAIAGELAAHDAVHLHDGFGGFYERGDAVQYRRIAPGFVDARVGEERHDDAASRDDDFRASIDIRA